MGNKTNPKVIKTGPFVVLDENNLHPAFIDTEGLSALERFASFFIQDITIIFESYDLARDYYISNLSVQESRNLKSELIEFSNINFSLDEQKLAIKWAKLGAATMPDYNLHSFMEQSIQIMESK